MQEPALLHESANGRFEKNGKRFDISDGAFIEGEMNELPCPPDAHGEEFESRVRTGDIAAAFFGYDHTNTFTAEIDGIKLVQSPGAGFHAYGTKRGGRLIVIDENKPYEYTSELIFPEWQFSEE